MRKYFNWILVVGLLVVGSGCCWGPPPGAPGHPGGRREGYGHRDRRGNVDRGELQRREVGD